MLDFLLLNISDRQLVRVGRDSETLNNHLALNPMVKGEDAKVEKDER